MNMAKGLLAISVILALSSCSSTGNHEPFTHSKTKTAEFDNVQYVCKTEKITGSHLTRQVCWTKEEYAEIEKDTENANERLRKKSLQSSQFNESGNSL